MLLLEEFEKISDFDLVESLSSDKYLMKHVTPILTKLIVKVAKVRPKDPIYFLVSTNFNDLLLTEISSVVTGGKDRILSMKNVYK